MQAKGLVISCVSNRYEIEVIKEKKKKEYYFCMARGKLKKQMLTPVVGDKVEIEITDEEKKEGVIEKIEERKSYSKRPKLANISNLLLVVSANMPSPDLYMLDKQLAFASYLQITPIIILNKEDLDPKEELDKIEKTYTKVGYEVIRTNAKEKKGIEKVRKAIKGKISAFAGNSGVGKSSLINALFGKNMTEEGLVSKKIKRGKNTTTISRLYELEEETYIADTPGFSTFEIYEIPSEQLGQHFIEFREFIPNCEFIGCQHRKERKCGVKDAVQEGKITKERYDRYCRIYEEIKEKETRKW